MFILSSKRILPRKLVYTWSKVIIDSIIFIVCLAGYIVIGIYNSPNIKHSKEIPDYLRIASEHLWLVGFVGVFIAVVSLVIIYIYLSTTKEKLGSPFEAVKVREHLAKWGGNEVSHTMFLRDKLLFGRLMEKYFSLTESLRTKWSSWANQLGIWTKWKQRLKRL